METTTDLMDLLEYTREAVSHGGPRPGEVFDKSTPEWHLSHEDTYYLVDDIKSSADGLEKKGGRLVPVCSLHREPPIGSVVRMYLPDETGAPLTRCADGWVWLDNGRRVSSRVHTWMEYVASANRAGRRVELVELAVSRG